MEILDASFLASSTDLARLPPPAYAEIAFAGRSNVGKSSLINSLLARKKLVRTSSKPGATRGINFFRVSLRGGGHLDLVDLPGYGFAKRSKAERRSWGPLIEGFLETRAGLRAVVLIVDARRGLEDDDHELIEYLDSLELGVFLVATKIDKLPAHQRKLAVEGIKRDAGRRVFPYSAESGEGREPLSRALLRACAIEHE
jgi:GTP-binding protein